MTLVRLQWRTSADFYTGMTPTIYDVMQSREQRGNHGTCDTSNNFFQFTIFYTPGQSWTKILGHSPFLTFNSKDNTPSPPPPPLFNVES